MFRRILYLAVMGAHGEHGIMERVISSTTARMLRESPVPVLVIQPRRNQTEGEE
jgi:nucleotide-binding universal stress UspA family protein